MTRDQHIENGRAALAKTKAAMEAMEQQMEPTDCCVACLFGERWRRTEDKACRQAEWLARLLFKRGGPGDVDEFFRICMEHELALDLLAHIRDVASGVAEHGWERALAIAVLRGDAAGRPADLVDGMTNTVILAGLVDNHVDPVELTALGRAVLLELERRR